jgi:hypothetical protein
MTFDNPRVIQEPIVISGYDPYYGQGLTMNVDSEKIETDIYGNATEKVSISGNIDGNVSANPLNLMVFDPLNQVTASYRIPSQNVTSGGIYHYEITLGEKLPRLYGQYVLMVSQNGQSAENQTIFQPRAPPSFATVTVDGNNSYYVQLTEHYMNVSSITANPTTHSLIISAFAGRNASVTVGVPRYLLDSTSENGMDKSFAVTVNGTATNYVQTASDSTARSLKIPLPEGKSVIMIQGTHMIPEFADTFPYSSSTTTMVFSLPMAAVILIVFALVRRRL